MNFLKQLFTSVLVSGLFILSLTGTAFAQTETDHENQLRKKLFVFNFKEDITAEQIDLVKEAFEALPPVVEGMISTEWGKDQDNSQKHAMVLTFESEEAHQRYADHPDHKAIGQKYGSFVASMEVVNYWVSKE